MVYYTLAAMVSEHLGKKNGRTLYKSVFLGGVHFVYKPASRFLSVFFYFFLLLEERGLFSGMKQSGL